MLSGVGLLRRDETYLRKAALLGLYLVAPLLLGLVIPGFTVLFLHFTPNAKLLLGLAPALVGVLFFSREFLRAVDVRAVWVLAIPMMCMLSFSFLYGRFLMAQKELESSTLYALAYDINAHSELRGVDHIYLVDSESPRLWLPAAFDTAQEVPALRYVGGWGDVDLNYLVLVEHFPRVGITNVKGMSAEVFKSITGQQRLVNNRFYDIYLSGRNGYIRLKPIMGPEGHQDRW
jgi:hypothetical protein